jgi:hypothetical protein
VQRTVVVLDLQRTEHPDAHDVWRTDDRTDIVDARWGIWFRHLAR